MPQSPSPQFRRLTGKLVASGEGCFWNHFIFIPAAREESSMLFKVSSGANAFLLHGVMARQPALLATAEFFAGQSSLMIEVAPEFALETEAPGVKSKHTTVPVMVRRAGYRPPSTAEAGGNPCGSHQTELSLPGGELVRSPDLPRFGTNHHPVYCILGTIIEPAGAVPSPAPCAPGGRAP